MISKELYEKELQSVKRDVRQMDADSCTKMEAVLWDYKRQILSVIESSLDQLWGCAPAEYSESGEECFNEGLSLAIKTIKEVLK